MTNEKPSNFIDSQAASAIPGIQPSGGILRDLGVLSDTGELVHPAIKEQLQVSSNREYDLVVIGSGPAGYVGAIRAAQLGARVAIIEKESVGGVCLNVGCIPTKTLLSSVEVLDTIKHSEAFGIKAGEPTVDISKMMERKQKTVNQLTSGVEGLFKKNKIKLFRGFGKIADNHTVTVESNGACQNITTDKILIATGSVPSIIPIPGLEIGEKVWTSNEALQFKSIPKKMLIIGAGAIGLEFGFTFVKLGTDVTVVEMMSQIMPAADTETANALQKSLEASGIKFMLNSTVNKAENTKSGKKIYVKTANGQTSDEYDVVLVAVGRRAIFDNIGLDNAGVKYDKRKVLVDEHMQTNVPNIYAVGDVVGEPMLAHIGWAEATVAIEHAYGMNVKMDYSAFPACVYTTPECSSVGMTEEKARERYKDVRVGKFTFQFNGKAMGMGETEGFVKIIIEPKYGQILGVHIIGPHATDLIAEAVLAMRNELTIEEVIAAIHPHPTLSEAVQEAALDAIGHAIHK